MISRIHDCLDGNTRRSVLTDEERGELEKLETTISESVVFIREARAPDVTSAVIKRIRDLEAEAPERGGAKTEMGLIVWMQKALHWIWAPSTVAFRPAWAIAGLALIAVGMGVLPLRTGGVPETAAMFASGSAGEPAVVGEAGETSVPVLYVRFEIEASGASSVSLAGSFTNWRPRYDLAETTPGHWTALVPLEAGVHDYAFVVDRERWVADPDAMPVRDGFGGINSRIALLSPEPEAARNGRSS